MQPLVAFLWKRINVSIKFSNWIKKRKREAYRKLRGSIELKPEKISRSGYSRRHQVENLGSIGYVLGIATLKFFHSFADGRKMKNQITSHFIDGVQVDDMQKIEFKVLSFFKQLYSDDHSMIAWFASWTCQSLSSEKIIWMERPFSEEEIH